MELVGKVGGKALIDESSLTKEKGKQVLDICA